MAHSSTSGLSRLPSLESLVAALSAAQFGSFSAAAHELDVTHAAVSRRIAVLEEWAGERLFDRHGRGVRLTFHGQRVLARASLALEQVAQLGRSDRTRRAVPTVRVAVTPSFARFWLLPRLRMLEGDPPTVRIEILADLKHVDVAAGEADLAIRYGRGGWPGLSEETLIVDRLVPVFATGARLVANPFSPLDIVVEALLHDADTTNWRSWSEAHLGKWRVKPSDRVLNDYASTVDAACIGLGMALWNVELHPPPPGLTVVTGLEVTGPFSHFLLRRTRDHASPAARLAQRICDACRRHEGWAGRLPP